MNRQKVMRILPWVVTPALVVVIIATWHLIVTIGKVNPFLFPPPAEVGAKFAGLFTSDNIWTQASRWSTPDLITKATGQPLNADFFKAHLKQRYLA